MDKARFAGATALQYFGLSSKEISIDDAANQLVRELTEENPAFGRNSPAFSAEVSASASDGALLALRIMHGEKPKSGHDQGRMFEEKIKDARKKYLKQAVTEDKAKLAADFDAKVKTLLVQGLSERTRLLYRGQVQKLNQEIQTGTSTKDQCYQEMVIFLQEIKDPKGYFLQMEVMNALSLIGNERDDVADGLFYLFRGELRDDLALTGKLNLFEEVLEEILNNKEFAPSEEDSRQKYRQQFIAKAREELASRLPEEEKKEYFKREGEQWAKLSQTFKYDDYRDSMLNWLMERPLEKALDSVLNLNGKNHEEVCHLLRYAMEEVSFYNYRQHSFFNFHPQGISSSKKNEGKLDALDRNFLSAAYRYVNSKPSISSSDEDKYKLFMAEARIRLQQALPENIRKEHKTHVKVIKRLLENGSIDSTGYTDSRNAYLLTLLASAESKKNSGSRTASSDSRKSGSNNSRLEGIVANALPKSITAERNEKDTLEALVLSWGGFVNNHRDGFNLHEFGQKKSEYMRAEKSYSNMGPDMAFNADSDFAIEARAQLVNYLPSALRQAYSEHDQMLRGHLGNGHITQGTYWRGMQLFLKNHFGS